LQKVFLLPGKYCSGKVVPSLPAVIPFTSLEESPFNDHNSLPFFKLPASKYSLFDEVKSFEIQLLV